VYHRTTERRYARRRRRVCLVGVLVTRNWHNRDQISQDTLYSLIYINARVVDRPEAPPLDINNTRTIWNSMRCVQFVWLRMCSLMILRCAGTVLVLVLV
jgi:hypothetical protein